MVDTRIAWQGGAQKARGYWECVTWVWQHMASFNRSFPSTPLKVHSQHLNLSSSQFPPPHPAPACSSLSYPHRTRRRTPQNLDGVCHSPDPGHSARRDPHVRFHLFHVRKPRQRRSPPLPSPHSRGRLQWPGNNSQLVPSRFRLVPADGSQHTTTCG